MEAHNQMMMSLGFTVFASVPNFYPLFKEKNYMYIAKKIIILEVTNCWSIQLTAIDWIMGKKKVCNAFLIKKKMFALQYSHIQRKSQCLVDNLILPQKHLG